MLNLCGQRRAVRHVAGHREYIASVPSPARTVVVPPSLVLVTAAEAGLVPVPPGHPEIVRLLAGVRRCLPDGHRPLADQRGTAPRTERVRAGDRPGSLPGRADRRPDGCMRRRRRRSRGNRGVPASPTRVRFEDACSQIGGSGRHGFLLSEKHAAGEESCR